MLPLTPTKLGRYEIVDEIGKGAMGVVYLARDPLIGRLVALKTFRIGYSVKDQEIEQFRVRFMREAQSAGILTHPNIVTIHDVVEDSGDGLAFIAMEYVRGTNLKLLLQGEQPLSLQFVLDIVAQVGDALDYAHSNRVVHRDVKPANILITSDNRVKITDFGIARLDTSNLTQEGQLLGTPNYMAPEQIQGREVDSRADLFSLGVVLYEMLTRHKPFQGENLTVVSHRIVYDHFTPPRDYAAELPLGVERILSKALEKDPARRYQRAREMVEELRRVVETTMAARADLNGTQSLSSTLVLPPSEPMPPPPPAAKPSLLSRWRSRSGPPPPPPADSGTRGSSASLPPRPPPQPSHEPMADTVATQVPALPAPRRPVPPGRLLAVGGMLVAVAVVAGAAVMLWRSWSQPASPEVADVASAAQPRTVELVTQGSTAMRRGDFPAAIALFRQAEQLDPSRQDLRRLREMAEAQQEEFKSLVDQEREIASDLAKAREALAARSYEQAVALSSLVLGIDPGNEDAKALLAQAQQGQAARQARQRTATAQPQKPAGEEASATPPAVGEERADSASESTPGEASTSTVRIHFTSELPEGVLIVWVKHQGRQQELLRDNFSTRGGLLQRFRKAAPYESSRSYSIPAGIGELIVHVAPRGIAARRDSRLGNFPGGGARSLDIHLSSAAQLTVALN
ncbi:MAG TPA: protein kinase [Thermoanaerobaculia bacterium]|jgi:serine/threonine protein kinase|nr:protein kinase [Thermoanaerobaculia bacterium]